MQEYIMYKIGLGTSSLISDIKWGENGDLFITFRTNDKKYLYMDVPKAEIIKLISAESIGKYFNSNIKNKYEFVQQGENI